jgi:hypothetical protein
MPRYYFHLASAKERSEDDVGTDYASVEAAFLDAHQAALDMSLEMLREHRDPSQYRFEISDSTGAVLFDLPFSEVILPGEASRKARVHLHSNVLHQWRMSKELLSEVQAKFAGLRSEYQQTERLVESTRMLLASALPGRPASGPEKS